MTRHIPAFGRRGELAVLASAALAAPALAQVGERTVKFILPNATGSGVDAITRAAQPALTNPNKVPAKDSKEFAALLKASPTGR